MISLSVHWVQLSMIIEYSCPFAITSALDNIYINFKLVINMRCIHGIVFWMTYISTSNRAMSIDHSKKWSRLI